jgi:prophage regulatory protein
MRAPDTADRLLRLDEVKRRVGLGKSMIYRLIQEGRFPAPYKVTPLASRWSDVQLRAWIDEVKDGFEGKKRKVWPTSSSPLDRISDKERRPLAILRRTILYALLRLLRARRARFSAPVRSYVPPSRREPEIVTSKGKRTAPAALGHWLRRPQGERHWVWQPVAQHIRPGLGQFAPSGQIGGAVIDRLDLLRHMGEHSAHERA